VRGGTCFKGHTPMLSIEITRECPLSCSGCYAYSQSHLGGKTTLCDLSDFRGDALVQGVLAWCGGIGRCMFHWWAASP
jgi:MoaA/NifB/PqqE/SkfB family radical SAM enzyme